MNHDEYKNIKNNFSEKDLENYEWVDEETYKKIVRANYLSILHELEIDWAISGRL